MVRGISLTSAFMGASSIQMSNLRATLLTLADGRADHDRIEAHNWLQDKFGNYIFWDSGLAFRHGAFGRESRYERVVCALLPV